MIRSTDNEAVCENMFLKKKFNSQFVIMISKLISNLNGQGKLLQSKIKV